MVPTTRQETRKYFPCGKVGPILKDCKQKEKDEKKWRESRACFQCCQMGHISKNCKNASSESAEMANDTATVTLPSAVVTISNSRKLNESIFDYACTPHIASSRNFISALVVGEGMVQIGHNEVGHLFKHGSVLGNTTVGGVRHCIALQDVAFAPDILLNLISASRAPKSGLDISINEDTNRSQREKVELLQKPSLEAMLVGLETAGGFSELVVQSQRCRQTRVSLVRMEEFGTNGSAIYTKTYCVRHFYT